MDTTVNVHNSGYWCVMRDDQSNLVFSGNNFVIQNPQTNEVRYLMDTPENRQYLQLQPEPPVDLQPEIIVSLPKRPKDVDTFWDKNKIKLLLTLCLDSKFRETPLSKEKNWDKMAPVIGASATECNKKYRSLRRTYIRLLKKKQQGKEVKWVYFAICEEVFQDSKCANVPTIEIWEDQKVVQLLSLYIDNLSSFRDPDCLKKDLWKEIARMIGTTEYNCYHKFKNLKRTYFNWLDRSKQTGKHIKWPFYHYFERIFHNYNPYIGPWDKNKTKSLLTAYLQISHKFKNPGFQKKELWKEIASMVGETPDNCDRKFRNLKQTYLKLKARADSGKGPTKWRFYKDFEDIFDNPGSTSTVSGVSPQGKLHPLHKYQENDYVKQLLFFYINNLEKFRNPLIKKKNLWKQISPTIGMNPEECDRKFRNLKQTYIRLAEKGKETVQANRWPYFEFFEKIFDEPILRSELKGECSSSKEDLENLTISEIQRVVEDVQERKDNDKKFERLIHVVEESNNIQKERNKILQQLLERKK